VSAGHPAGRGLRPGTVIAGYRIEALISRTAMATVFRAHDERLGRTVALKVLAPTLANDRQFRARFLRESHATAITDHPHVIPVFEAGEAAGVLFIAMRFVRGGDVRGRLSKLGPFAPAMVVNLVSQAASALDAAHARGLVHRDVKPGNLLLEFGAEMGRPDHIYLSDFGLSKISLAAGTRTPLTAAGQVIGTLDYMAPEQIDGGPLDGRADQYGLACTAYELLCGAPPFGDRPDTALMRAHRSEAPPPVTSRRTGLPAAADAVFARALAKAPGERYGSCGEFAEALRAAIGRRRSRPDPRAPAPAGVASDVASQLAGPPGTTPPEAASYPSTAPTVVRRQPAAAPKEASSIYSQETEERAIPRPAPRGPGGEQDRAPAPAEPQHRRRLFSRRGEHARGGRGTPGPGPGQVQGS